MTVGCIVIPHFAVELELQDRPELRRLPLMLVTPQGPQPVLDCSPEAEAAGVRPAMAARLALARCRDAAVLEADPARYAEAWEVILEDLEAVAPVVEPAGLGAAYLDLAGLHGLYPSHHRLAQALLAAVPAFLDARIGIAEGKFAARIAAAHAERRRPLLVPGEETATFLAPHSVQYLPVSPEMLRRLELFAIETLGQLAALPVGPLEAQFGLEGRRAWELARGIDREPVRPRRREVTITARLSLPAPSASLDALLAALQQLLSRTFASPHVAGRTVRQASLRVALSGGRRWEERCTLREATADRERVFLALRTRLERATLPAPVEELTLELSGLCGETGKQAGLLAEKGRRTRQLAEALRQLRARFGWPQVQRVVEVEPWSRIPERTHALIDYEP